MASVYVPKGTKRKSKVEIMKTAEAYLTNGRYDQRKSAMIAEAHKVRITGRQKAQAKERKRLKDLSGVFSRMERLAESTLVWNSTSQQQHGRR